MLLTFYGSSSGTTSEFSAIAFKRRRSKVLPNVATIDESGCSSQSISLGRSLLLPAIAKSACAETGTAMNRSEEGYTRKLSGKSDKKGTTSQSNTRFTGRHANRCCSSRCGNRSGPLE